MRALPGPNGADNPTWQAFRYGYGPYADGIFIQSNFGIMTKMGLWLMPETEHLTFMVTFRNGDDFGEIVETIKPLMIKKILRDLTCYPGTSCHRKEKGGFLPGCRPDSEKLFAIHIKDAFRWLLLGFYGEIQCTTSILSS